MNDKLLKKIEKLERLAESTSFKHEKESALAKARELRGKIKLVENTQNNLRFFEAVKISIEAGEIKFTREALRDEILRQKMKENEFIANERIKFSFRDKETEFIANERIKFSFRDRDIG